MDDFEEVATAKLNAIIEKLDELGAKDDEISDEISSIRQDLRILRDLKFPKQ